MNPFQLIPQFPRVLPGLGNLLFPPTITSITRFSYKKTLAPSFRQSVADSMNGQPNTFLESSLSLIPLSSASSSDCLGRYPIKISAMGLLFCYLFFPVEVRVLDVNLGFQSLCMKSTGKPVDQKPQFQLESYRSLFPIFVLLLKER